MFGGQDGDTSAPRDPGGQDDTLHGVNDIADGTTNDGTQDAGYAAAPPADPAPSDAPEPHNLPEPQAEPAEAQPAEEQPQDESPAPEPVVDAEPAADTGSDDLIDLKQKALQQLTPIVGHLDQTPEEKFRTTMMLIQASDNQALLGEAYEAANAIEDEKVKAQALLDVINEINYFTQNKQ